jgi:D-3-phosphoglycerate dehydrogenase
MKILVADKFEQSGLEGLKSLGCSVVYDPSLKDDALVDAIRMHNPDVLVVRSTQGHRADAGGGRPEPGHPRGRGREHH